MNWTSLSGWLMASVKHPCQTLFHIACWTDDAVKWKQAVISWPLPPKQCPLNDVDVVTRAGAVFSNLSLFAFSLGTCFTNCSLSWPTWPLGRWPGVLPFTCLPSSSPSLVSFLLARTCQAEVCILQARAFHWPGSNSIVKSVRLHFNGWRRGTLGPLQAT